MLTFAHSLSTICFSILLFSHYTQELNFSIQHIHLCFSSVLSFTPVNNLLFLPLLASKMAKFEFDRCAHITHKFYCKSSKCLCLYLNDSNEHQPPYKSDNRHKLFVFGLKKCNHSRRRKDKEVEDMGKVWDLPSFKYYDKKTARTSLCFRRKKPFRMRSQRHLVHTGNPLNNLQIPKKDLPDGFYKQTDDEMCRSFGLKLEEILLGDQFCAPKTELCMYEAYDLPYEAYEASTVV